MSAQVLRIKLGASMSGPSKRLPETLRAVAMECNRARNAVVRGWIRWREDNPSWTPGQRRDRKGNPKVAADGKPMLEPAIMSQDIHKQLYHLARSVNRGVSSNVMSACWSEVIKRLKNKTPYNHPGDARYIWQAVLNYECSPPSYRSLAIPVPNKCAGLVYEGFATQAASDKAKALGESGCVLQFPVWSEESGRAMRNHIVRLNVGEMSRGHRKIIRRVASGELKMSDSVIVESKGKWYFNLVYKHPGENLGLNPDRTAILELNDPGDQNPFLLRIPENGRPYYLGHGKDLVAEWTRLSMRRRVMRFRYRSGRRQGRGKGKFFAGLRPYERSFIDMQDMVAKQMVADIVKLLAKHDCGSLEYREPTKPVRDFGWYAKRGVPWNWTSFDAKLRFKMTHYGIAVPKKWTRCAMAEYREKYPDAVPKRKEEK